MMSIFVSPQAARCTEKIVDRVGKDVRIAVPIGLSEKQLKDAPALSDDSWTDRNWEKQTHRHYDVTPYWM